MANDASNIRIDAAQTAGAIWIAPKGSTLPTDATTALDAAFTCVGIIGADGVTDTPSSSSSDIQDMNGSVVATVESGYKSEFSFPMLETNKVSLQLYHDSTNVTATAGDTGAPDVLTVQGGAPVLEHHAVVRETVSNGLKARRVWPDAKVTGRDATKVVGTDASTRPVTLTAYPFDSAGHTYTDYIEVPNGSTA